MLFTVIDCWYDNEVNVVFIGRVFMFSCCLCQIVTLPKQNFITLSSSFSELPVSKRAHAAVTGSQVELTGGEKLF